MRRIFFFLLSCFLATCVQAQEQKVVPQSISYIKLVPAFVAQMMPRESKSLFWGKFSLDPKQVPIGFHFHSLYAPQLKEKERYKYNLALDVFSLGAKPRLQNRVFLTYKLSGFPTTYDVSFTWLKPKDHYWPVIIIKSFSQGSYGPLGVEHYIAFPNGWDKAAQTMSLRFGSWNASDTVGESNRLVLGRYDQLEIHVSLFNSQGEEIQDGEHNYTFKVEWDLNLNPNDFAASAEGDQKWVNGYFTGYQ